MHSKTFIDKVKIKVIAGKGGDGAVSFRREKYIPKGGPDGGDGGNGGDVYFEVNHNMSTLLDFRSKPNYSALPGVAGGKKKMSGANGEDFIIYVPAGTLVYEVVSEHETLLVGDLTGENEETSRLLIARGGVGGKGNNRFKSSTNQTPIQYTKGTLGEQKDIILEIKMIADIGLIGYPSSGKSTLINYLTNTNVKTAAYPFTTLVPNLGRYILKNKQEVVIADIPGLIEGASTGKGLGDDFLRHIERTRLLVHLIDPLYILEDDLSNFEIVQNSLQMYKKIRKELNDYGANLNQKKEIVVINKIDITEIKDGFESIKNEFKKLNIDLIGISAVTGEGIEALDSLISQYIKQVPKVISLSNEVIKKTKVYTINNLPNKRIVKLGNVSEMQNKLK